MEAPHRILSIRFRRIQGVFRSRKIYGNSALQEGCCYHKDDKQHQHDIDDIGVILTRINLSCMTPIINC